MIASISWPVQTFTIEGDHLCAVPHNAKGIIRHAEAKDDDLQKCEFIGKAVDLDGNGQTIDLIVTRENAVGWDAALGPIRVLRHVGDSFAIVLSDGGYAVTTGKEKRA